jgi:hypothetical protein
MTTFFPLFQQLLEMIVSLVTSQQQHHLHQTHKQKQQHSPLILVPAPWLETQASIAMYKQVKEREDFGNAVTLSRTSATT